MAKIPGIYQRCQSDCPPRCRRHPWAFALELAAVDGKRQRFHRSGFTTQREAIEGRDALRTAHRKRRPREGDSYTVADALEAWWARGLTARGEPWRLTTRLGYRANLDLYLLPELGLIQLSELRASDIETAYSRARAERKVTGATIARAHACLRAAVRLALRDEHISQDHTGLVAVPTTRPKVDPWTLPEWHAFAAATSGDRLGPLYRLAVDGGMRRGELLALRWKDVDLANGIVTVRTRSGPGRDGTLSRSNRRLAVVRTAECSSPH